MSPISPLLSSPVFALIGDVGGGELLVVLAAILVLFGGKGVPGIARTLGKITKDLQKASQDFKDQLLTADQPEPPPPPQITGNNHPLFAKTDPAPTEAITPAPDPHPALAATEPKESMPHAPAG